MEEKRAGSENLKPWKEGQSGNPNGRPKGSKNRATIVREILNALVDEKNDEGKPTGKKIPAVEAITRAQLIKALSGDPKAYELLMDSSFGKITDKVQTTHTFKQMGRVKVEEKSADNPEAPASVKELSFDVGLPVKDPDAEDEDDAGDDVDVEDDQGHHHGEEQG